MKIIHINGVNKSGSTGAIITSINKRLTELCVESYVCYGIGPKSKDAYKFCYRYEQAIYRRISKITGLRYGFAPFSTHRLIRFLKQEKPDIVHLHSINGNCVNILKLLKWLKKNEVPTVITNHAEFYYTGNCTSTYGCQSYINGCYNCPRKKWATDGAYVQNTHRSWQKMKTAFNGFTRMNVVCVSPYSKKKSIQSPILSKFEHSVILNGVDTASFYPRFDIDIRKKLNISKNTQIFLFVTSEFSVDKKHLKGGYYLLKLAESMSDSDCKFLIIGRGGEKISNTYKNVVCLNQINDSNLLACYYTQANALLTLSRSESFGMTCAESLCCGTPVVGFCSGGPESISLPEYSFFTEYGKIDELEKVLTEVSRKFADQKKEISQKAAQIYSSQRMADEYIQLYKRIYKDS